MAEVSPVPDDEAAVCQVWKIVYTAENRKFFNSLKSYPVLRNLVVCRHV